FIKNKSQWVFHCQFLIAHHTRKYQCDKNIENRANNKRINHPSGQVPLRILTLLRRRRNSIKTNVGKENGRDAFQYTTKTIREKGRPILGSYKKETQYNSCKNNNNL